jgi:hypothetical protein
VFLSYRVASINPISINVDGGREIFTIASISRGRKSRYSEEGWLTINGALELLVANLAGQLANAGFLIELNSDRFLVVTEQAWERRGEGLVLQRT